MMTTSTGNVFHVTGPSWEESTGHRWIPPHEGFDFFLRSAPDQTVEKTIETPKIYDAITLIKTSL